MCVDVVMEKADKACVCLYYVRSLSFPLRPVSTAPLLHSSQSAVRFSSLNAHHIITRGSPTARSYTEPKQDLQHLHMFFFLPPLICPRRAARTIFGF